MSELSSSLVVSAAGHKGSQLKTIGICCADDVSAVVPRSTSARNYSVIFDSWLKFTIA